MDIRKHVAGWKIEHDSQIREFRLTLRLLRKGPPLLGIIIVLCVLFLAFFAPLLATHNPSDVNFPERFLPPSTSHFFGTDSAGQDVYSKVIYGARYDLFIGLVVIALAAPLGSILGIIAGYRGGKIDSIIMRITDVFFAVPAIVLALAISAAIGWRGLEITVIAIAAVWWPFYTRITRGITLQIREEQYIEAARSLGARMRRIILKHVLPNAVAPIIVQATLDLGYVILTAATLSFLGLGAQPGDPEWGRIVAEGRPYIQDYPWIITFPGMATFLTCLGFNLLGDGLRDVLDPTLRRARG
jgi:peptide/nickel transport system permease protein